MAGHKVGANGRLCINSSGQAIICGCCCPHCAAGTVASSGTLSASGIIVPTSCINTPADPTNCPGSANTSIQAVGMNPNVSGLNMPGGAGVFGGTCCSFLNGDNLGTLYDGCVGNPSAVTTTGKDWLLDLGSYPGFAKLICFSTFPGSGLDDIAFFIGTLAIPTGTDCGRTLTFNNDLTSTGAYYKDPQLGCVIPMGTGGSAVITFP